MRFSKAVVKCRVPILILTLLLMIPAVLGMAGTRINYDMLDYLPEDMDTVAGQNELLEEFNKGAFSLLILEDLPEKEAAALKAKVERVDHVETVLWYDSLMDLSVPMELLPEKLYQAFNTENATMMAVFFDTSTSSDLTMDAIREIRALAGEQCFVSGMSALVTDLKDLCEREEPIYVGIAVALACGAMLLLLDSWLVPFVFLASIGMMILLNLGTNYFLGEISYITKALSAVLQLAVTMDYSIFLWNSYNEQRARRGGHEEAMIAAIDATLASVTGSAVTTIAGFIALCFMSFTMGRDLGIVMAKGVLLGVVGVFWTPYSTTAMSASEKFSGPSLRHLFGTDNFGRDIFSRVMQGLGTTISISSLVVLFSGSVGILLGAVTGYFGGLLDEVVMRITDALNGFPSILLTLVIISVLGSGRQNVIISLGLVFMPSFIRIVRSEFIRLRDMDYIRRARLMGVGKRRILFVHMLPNIFSVFWVSVMIGFNNAILAESGMSYLGIGVQPPDASLGKMLSDAQGYLQSAPWYALAPGLTIVWVVLGFSLFGEGIRRSQ